MQVCDRVNKHKISKTAPKYLAYRRQQPRYFTTQNLFDHLEYKAAKQREAQKFSSKFFKDNTSSL